MTKLNIPALALLVICLMASPHAAYAADGDASPALIQVPAHADPAPDQYDSNYNWRRHPDGAVIAEANTERTGTAASGSKDRVHSWETGAGKSYLIPAVEIPTFLLMMNLADRVIYSDERSENGKKAYDSNFSTTWQHIRRQNWAFDQDPFNVNQFAHPYEGATMYGLARSCGLGFWQSWAYSNVGSYVWEMAGETTHPSINDIIVTGNSGSLLGEALFRMSSLMLKSEHPDLWHELGAAVVSPPTSFNRWALGDRFKEVFPSHDPATFWRFRLGVNVANVSDATLDFAMSYGLPGKPDYSYRRPLDYFDFQISGLASRKNPVGNVLLRGLLAGKTYEWGEDYRGIWGIYGSYDYIAPTIFRISTTALSLGTTGQYWLAPGVALQGSVLGGVGFGGAGVTPTSDGKRDYHYGVTPQGMAALRLILGTRVALENVVRGYYVSGAGADSSEGNESIVRVNNNVIVRVYRRHGLGLQIVEAVRHAHYGNLPARHQSELAFGIFYTFLGDSHFGAVEWRTPPGS